MYKIFVRKQQTATFVLLCLFALERLQEIQQQFGQLLPIPLEASRGSDPKGFHDLFNLNVLRID